MLHRISKSPTYGYEILTELEQKTEGAWRPGAGSIYPLLKKLEREGFIASEQTGGRKIDHRRYTITEKGIDRVRQSKEMFKMMSSKFSRMRWVFLDLLDPSEISEYIVEGTKKNFETVRELAESNRIGLPDKELQLVLREYLLALERQQDWAISFLNSRAPALKSPQRRRSA